MAILKLTRECRDYILKAEREGYWEQRILKLEQELASLPADNEDYETKKEELEDVKKSTSEAKKHLEKHGPTTWKLHSISKLTLNKALGKDSFEIGTFNRKKQVDNIITTGSIAMINTRAIHTVRLGLDGWSNLRDAEGSEIPFNRDLVELLDDGILYELANEISGNVEVEEEKN